MPFYVFVYFFRQKVSHGGSDGLILMILFGINRWREKLYAYLHSGRKCLCLVHVKRPSQ